MRLLTYIEKEKVYPELFKRVFGFENLNEVVGSVFVHEDQDGNLRGFVSGYMIAKNTFYMAWGGLAPGLTFKGTRKYWQSVEKELFDRGLRFIETKVENTNTHWQRTLMGMGYIPHGVHYADRKVYIEYCKALKG